MKARGTVRETAKVTLLQSDWRIVIEALRSDQLYWEKVLSERENPVARQAIDGLETIRLHIQRETR